MIDKSCNLDALHGMTVVLDTAGPKAYVGRFDQALGDYYVVNDVDIFSPSPETGTKEAWLVQAARYGVWVKQKQYYVPAAEITSVRRLSEYKEPA